MKKLFVLALMAMFVVSLLCGTVAASMQVGPAPNSGDGIPDGSGMDGSFQNGDPEVIPPGPTPNPGDGILGFWKLFF